MKKRKNQQAAKTEDKPLTLGDMLNDALVKQLKETKQALKADEEKKALEEEERKKEERRLKEKNKSFEDLLNESGMNWKEFK